MADPVQAQIIVGQAVVWTAPVGEALPDETTITYGTAWGGNWARVGYTKAPVVLAYNSEEMDVFVEEVLAAVKRVKISEEATLETVLAELTADYLQFGVQGTVATTAAGASQVGFEQLPIGAIDVEQLAWGFEGRYNDGTTDFPLRVFIPIGTAKLNGPLAFAKADWPGISLQIKALADTTSANELAIFQRVTELEV